MAQAPAAAAPAAAGGAPSEEPAGMEEEARLFHAFASLPSLARVVASQGKGGAISLTVRPPSRGFWYVWWGDNACPLWLP